jgi:hypothetical protein
MYEAPLESEALLALASRRVLSRAQ